MISLNRILPQGSGLANRLYRVIRLYHVNRSGQAWRTLFSYFYRRMLGRAVPTYVCIAPTYRCQCRCPHCYSNAPWRGEQEELGTQQFKSIIDQAKRMGVLQVNFSAGEPLLRDDIVELVRHAHDAGLITRINTNGLLLDRNRVSELKKAGLTQCGVSIDDADPETHDELRGVPGAHAKALEGIRNLRESGILCQTLTCVTRRNLASGLEKIVELGKQLGVMSVYFFFPVAVGRWDCDYDQVLTEAERAKVRELRDMTFVHLELPTFRSKCILITKEILFVSPMGDVTPCPFVPYAMGNVKKHALSHMWQRYCAGLNVDYEGECPMNDPQCRDTIERHIENTRL